MDVVVKDVIVVFNTPDANNQAATTRSNPKKLILKLTPNVQVSTSRKTCKFGLNCIKRNCRFDHKIPPTVPLYRYRYRSFS